MQKKKSDKKSIRRTNKPLEKWTKDINKEFTDKNLQMASKSMMNNFSWIQRK